MKFRLGFLGSKKTDSATSQQGIPSDIQEAASFMRKDEVLLYLGYGPSSGNARGAISQVFNDLRGLDKDSVMSDWEKTAKQSFGPIIQDLYTKAVDTDNVRAMSNDQRGKLLRSIPLLTEYLYHGDEAIYNSEPVTLSEGRRQAFEEYKSSESAAASSTIKGKGKAEDFPEATQFNWPTDPYFIVRPWSQDALITAETLWELDSRAPSDDRTWIRGAIGALANGDEVDEFDVAERIKSIQASLAVSDLEAEAKRSKGPSLTIK